MCGIAGLISLDGRALPGPQTLDAMCRTIVHRGPDDQGTFHTDWAAIGMRRLSIIDVAGGHQPVTSAGGRIQLVFNGEIYNFRELRQTLEARGYVFQSHSDSECIAHAYAEYGTDCFAMLRGMFAIAIVDQDRRRLVLARDRIGKKPLYLGELSPGVLGFGSELKTLLAVPGWQPRISMDAVQDFFSLGYIPAPDTIFEGIGKLPPGHWMSIEPGQDGGAPNIVQTRYSHVDFLPKWTDDYLALVALANPADLRLLFGERAHADPFGSVRQRFVRSDIDSHAEQILSGDMDTYLVDDILVKVDRTTMANSLEARAPLLDQNLIAFAARLPFDLKLRGEQGKYLFRKVAARLLPAEVLTKRKQGFAIPLATWFRNDLRPMLLDTIGSRAFKERGIFDQAGIQRLVDEHQQGLQDRGELLWMVMVLETWMRTLPDQTSPSPMH